MEHMMETTPHTECSQCARALADAKPSRISPLAAEVRWTVGNVTRPTGDKLHSRLAAPGACIRALQYLRHCTGSTVLCQHVRRRQPVYWRRREGRVHNATTAHPTSFTPLVYRHQYHALPRARHRQGAAAPVLLVVQPVLPSPKLH